MFEIIAEPNASKIFEQGLITYSNESNKTSWRSI